MKRRKVDLLILSDIHLGTYGCHAKELVKYLKSIQPDTLILNGDIIDMWQFRKKYWPDAHTKVLKQIIGFNVDPNFTDALDGLIILDIEDLPENTLEDLQRGLRK